MTGSSSESETMMDDWTLAEKLLLDLFLELRDRLLGEYGVGVMLIAQGQDFALKVRTRRNTGHEKQPHFSLTIREQGGAMVVTLKPRGLPGAELETTRLGCETPDIRDALLATARGTSSGRSIV